MRAVRLACSALVGVLAQLSFANATARELTFEERVKAQRAIERVYYAHQIGVKRTFDQAMPRAVLEKKVRTYLRQSDALAKRWKTPLTAEMLHGELERIAQASRMPERLKEIYDALDNDPFLIEECLARATLADRLTRGLFASDAALHAETREEAWDGAAWVAPVSTGSAALPLPGNRADGTAGSSCGSDDTWDIGSLDDVPEARDSHSAIWTGSLMVVWGGRAPSGSAVQQALGSRYDPVTDSWTPVSTMGAPAARYLHTAVWTGSLMIVWGGTDGSIVDFDSGGRYDPSSDTWTPTATAGAPTSRLYHTAVWTGSRMLVWGGVRHVSGPPGSGNLNTGGQYDPDTDTWSTISTSGAPSPRYLHAAAWTGNVMVVWGGYDGSYLATGGRYDPVAGTWTPTTTIGAPSGRYFLSNVWTGARMIVWGGIGNLGASNSGGRYDPVADSWTPTTTTGAPSPRGRHTAIWTGSKMIAWGGFGTASPFNDGGGSYDPMADSWTPTSPTGRPSLRFDHTAVWTGDLMVIWGGGSNTGGRYDPDTDSWTPTTTGGAPSARSAHTAVWTGNVMVVWGGPTSTGGRYDPALDTWTPTSTTGAPSPRVRHVAVWTGNEMIVWGSYTDTGGRYDPLTDAWLPTSTVGAPTGEREEFDAVWTGTHMVVWGGVIWMGFDPHVVLNTGGRYDPATDTWTPTSTVGAPSGRCYHTTTWTGTSMVVWGGQDADGTRMNTGGRYDPVSDTWLPTSLSGAPAARAGHEAVWTGSRLIVWGEAPTGGRYDPLADTWMPTSTTGAPTARFLFTAVWTGSRMLVWGGSGADTGGRYDPAADSWLPTSTLGVPAGRRAHSAVWTGTRMIVWGGLSNGNAAMNSGGSYVLGAADDDGDGLAECQGDCDDANDQIWGAPGEALALTLTKGVGTVSELSWIAPATGGTAGSMVYDVLRSTSAGDFVGSGICIESNAGPATGASEAAVPNSGAPFFFLVGAENACGAGSLGVSSSGAARTGASCP